MEPEEEGVMSCVTCGHEISMKTCLKHMERCYNKVKIVVFFIFCILEPIVGVSQNFPLTFLIFQHESQTSFASIAKTNVEGIRIFCDYYNPSNKTYCKRLEVLCPEHSREPKVKDNEVLGKVKIRFSIFLTI